MRIAINETDARPIYQQIVDEVRRGIVVGALTAEDPLPSVRQLAAELRVNPNTVQQAYRELEREGLVQMRRGKGTFVADMADGRTIRERRKVAAAVAEAAIREARRSGVDVAELIDAIRRAAGGDPAVATTVKGAVP